MEKKKINCIGAIAGWIELFMLMTGVFLVFINYNVPIGYGYDKVVNISFIFLVLGIAAFWKQMVSAGQTFGYLVDICWMLAVVTVIFGVNLDKWDFWAAIAILTGLIVDLLRTYYSKLNK